MQAQQQIPHIVHALLQGDFDVWEQGYHDLLFRREIAARQGDWPVFDYEYAQRDILYRYVNDTVLKNRPIDYLEFGVFAGHSFRTWLSLNTRPESRFVGFDSFEGLPEDWIAGNRKKGEFNMDGKIPVITDPRGSFVKGWFNQTLEPFLEANADTFGKGRQLVLHLDADLFSSTLYVLTTLNRIIRRGTVLVFDDFQARDDFAALHHFTRAAGWNWRILAARRGLGKLAAVLY